MKILLNSILLLLILLTTVSPVHGERLQLSTLNWEPYIGDKLTEQGYVARLVREAFSESGYTPQFSFFPWARVVYMANRAEYAGFFPEYYSETRAEKFLFSDPFPAGPLVFFKKKGFAIQYDSLEDLKPYKIGVVRGYVNSEEFDKSDHLEKIEGVNDLTNFRKLLSGWLDLVVADQYVGQYILKTYLTDRKDEVEVLYPVLEEKQLYLCLSKDYPNAAEIMDRFNQGLKRMQDSGRLRRVTEGVLLEE